MLIDSDTPDLRVATFKDEQALALKATPCGISQLESHRVNLL
jgi:hypothetical protein